MEKLYYTDVEFRKDEDGFDVKYVYVPILDEWMTEEEFQFEKSCYDPAMSDARMYEEEYGNDDVIDDYDDDEEDDDDYDDECDYDDNRDYSSMTREEAIEEYNRTGINHSEHDLNDWDDINSRLGFDFYKPNH